jgi:flagellar biosynthesis protein FlhB
MRLVLPLMGTVVLVGLLINIAQVGFHFTLKPLEPKLSKFSIIKGVKRILSLKSLIELVKSVSKVAVIGGVTFLVIRAELEQFFLLYQYGTATILVYMLTGAFKIFIWVSLVMAIVAVSDYYFQRWQFEKQLKMSKQEIKDEHKQTEGDPQVKARIRSIQVQSARRRMMQAIPEADVVVTNPTRLALAIRYDAGSMHAPRVVAKGAGLVAKRIRELASAHDVPVIENKELAQNLYRLVGIDEEIHMDLYQGVAELLAYVYKLKRKTMG